MNNKLKKKHITPLPNSALDHAKLSWKFLNGQLSRLRELSEQTLNTHHFYFVIKNGNKIFIFAQLYGLIITFVGNNWQQMYINK